MIWMKKGLWKKTGAVLVSLTLLVGAAALPASAAALSENFEEFGSTDDLSMNWFGYGDFITDITLSKTGGVDGSKGLKIAVEYSDSAKDKWGTLRGTYADDMSSKVATGIRFWAKADQEGQEMQVIMVYNNMSWKYDATVKLSKTGKYYEIDWREEDLRACIDDDFDGDALAVVEAYFANVAKVAEKKPTILGHFDLIKKINGDGKFFDENDPRYTAAANAALMTAARNRCVLEVNTSAAYRGFRKDYFPSDAILKDWLILSGNVVITADAHDAKALTYGFEEAAAKLKELGYTKVQVLGKDGFIPCAL